MQPSEAGDPLNRARSRTGTPWDRNGRAVAALAFLLACVMPLDGRAADAYPDRLVRMVLATPAGTASDLAARILAEGLEREFGQRVIVDNRPGADGVIAVGQVTAAPADGHTLLFALGSQITVNPSLFAALPYDPQRDLVPVSLVSRQVTFIGVNATVPVSTIREFVEYTQARRGTVSYAAGSSTFMLAGESFKQRTGADMLYIPYNGSAAAVAALVGGIVQACVGTARDAIAQVRSGRIRVLAVSGSQRLPQLPDVPSFAEAGLEDDVPVWVAVYAPAGTPKAVVEKLNGAIVRVLSQPPVRERFAGFGDLVVASAPEALAAVAAQDAARIDALVRRIGLSKR
ncbi:MAG: tripartite tricarboxylate transporter substrate binding protein [Betaproteobacteria bacterium]